MQCIETLSIERTKLNYGKKACGFSLDVCFVKKDLEQEGHFEGSGKAQSFARIFFIIKKEIIKA